MNFWIYVGEELYYPCSETKGADQLCSYYRTDPSAPMFSPMHVVGFLMWWLISSFDIVKKQFTFMTVS